MPAISTLTGDFTDSSVWTLNGGGGSAFSTSRASTRLDILNSATASYAKTTTGWSLASSEFTFRIYEVPMAPLLSIELRDGDGTTDYYRVICSSTAGNWQFQKNGTQVGSTWTDATMRAKPYVRFRESGGTTFLETSADGVTGWSQPATGLSTANISNISNLAVRIIATASAINVEYASIQEVNGAAAPTTRLVKQEIGDVVVSAGVWTNPSNSTSFDSAVAQDTGAVQNTEYPIDVGGFDFSSIPDGSTIHAIRYVASVRTLTDVTRGQYKQEILDGSTSLAAGAFTQYPSTSSSPVILATLAPTLAQLKSANLKVRLINKRVSSSATTAGVNSVMLVVEYTPPASAKGKVVVGGSKKTIANRWVVVGGVKKTVVNAWVIVGGAKKTIV